MDTGQSRRASLVEAVTNAAVGYAVAVAAQIAILPLFGAHLTVAQNAASGLLFTAVSIARSFALRRLFNLLAVRLRDG